MRSKIIPLLLLLTILMSACSAAPTPEPTATNAPPTDTPAPSPTPEPSPTLEPTVAAPPTEVPVVEPPSIETAGVLGTDQFVMTAPTTLAQSVEWSQQAGVPFDPNVPGGVSGMPPYLLVTYDNEQITPEFFLFDERQGRIFPVEAYENMYASMDPNPVSQQVQELQSLPDTAMLDATSGMPMLPMQNAVQVFAARARTINFSGGRGVAYLSMYSQGVQPITNQSLYYFFQGLSTDGSQYLSFVYPVDSTLLPASVDVVPPEVDQALSADPAKYNQDTAAALTEAGATDFTPNLDLLDNMFASIQLNTAAPGDATLPPLPTNTVAAATLQPTSAVTLAPLPTATSTAVYAGEDIVDSWYWISLEPASGSTITPDDPDRYTVTFGANGGLAARGDCKTANGSYTLRSRDRLTIDFTGPAQPEDEDCDDDLWERFFSELEDAASYQIDDNRLIISQQDGGTMRFGR
jgi:heat shock protein HslJ